MPEFKCCGEQTEKEVLLRLTEHPIALIPIIDFIICSLKACLKFEKVDYPRLERSRFFYYCYVVS